VSFVSISTRFDFFYCNNPDNIMPFKDNAPATNPEPEIGFAFQFLDIQ